MNRNSSSARKFGSCQTALGRPITRPKGSIRPRREAALSAASQPPIVLRRTGYAKLSGASPKQVTNYAGVWCSSESACKDHKEAAAPALVALKHAVEPGRRRQESRCV